MALTKVTGQVIKNTTDVTVGVLTVTNTLAVGGTVSIGGTLTYEDVTNVDAVGLVTARNGIVVGSGITLSKDGDVFFTGIATGNGSGLTALNASNIGSGTVPTARLGSGTASSSTFLRGDSTFAAVTLTTINSNADNRLITGSGTANTLNGEANLAFDGTGLGLVGHIDIRTGSSINTNVTGGSASGTLHKNTTSGQFAIVSGGTGGNNYLSFFTSASAAPTEKLRIHADGEVEIKEATAGQTVLSATALYSASSNVDIATFARSGGAVASAIRYADASTSMLFGTTTSHAFGVMTGGTERLRIKSDGKVGVGNASPTFLLDVKGATTDTFRISNSNETGHGDADAKIVAGGSYYQNIRFEASKHKFITFDGSSTYERLRITSDGKIGIGVDSPTSALHLKKGGGDCIIELQRSGTNTTGNVGVLNFTASDGHSVGSIGAYGDGDNEGAYINFKTTSAASGNSPFNTTSERYRIHSNGKHSWNNTSFPYNETFHFYNGLENSGASFYQNSSNDHTNVIMRHGRALSGYNGYQMLFKRNDGTDVGSIISGASSTSFNTSSDYRLKENQITIPNAIDKLNKLKPYEFNFKDDPDYKHLGFFAHEVQEVIPNGVAFGEKDEVYTEDAPNESDDYKKGDMRIQSLDYGKLTPLLTAALQEAIVEIESLKAEVAALKSS